MESIRKRCEQKRSSLEIDRQTFMPHWRELSEYHSPRRGRFVTSDWNRGEKRNQKIVNSAPVYAKRTLSAGMANGITSQSRPWFRLATPDPELMEYAPVRQWLYAVESRMRQVFSRSNLYSVTPTFFGEMGLFATGSMCLLEDDESVIRLYPYTIGSYSIAQNERLVVDTIIRDKIKMTVRQLVAMFGINSVSPQVKDMWQRGDYEQAVDVIHVIQPRLERDLRKTDNRNMPFESIWYEAGGSGWGNSEPGLLRHSGFEEFPVLCGRWETTAEDVWGTDCPGMVTLGDAKQLQYEERTKAKVMDKHVDPPMRADPSLRNHHSSIVAGGITYVESGQGRDGFAPAIQTSPQAVGMVRESITDVEWRIKRGWFEDLFLQLANDTRSQTTAHEIALRHEEKLLMLGPVLERTNSEVLDNLVDRTFSIMLRRGMLPEPPEELQGIDLRVEYISVLAQAQKMVALGAMDRYVGFVGAVAQLKPNAVDKFDADQSIDEYADALGVPPGCVVSDDIVLESRAEQAEQEQMAQAAASAKPAADMINALAKVNMGEDTALTRMAANAAGAPI